jgi:hypothetical protein
MSIRSVVKGIIAGVGVKFFMQYAIILLGHAGGATSFAIGATLRRDNSTMLGVGAGQESPKQPETQTQLARWKVLRVLALVRPG